MGCGASGVHVPTTAAWPERLTRAFYRETRFLQFCVLGTCQEHPEWRPQRSGNALAEDSGHNGVRKGEGDKPVRRGEDGAMPKGDASPRTFGHARSCQVDSGGARTRPAQPCGVV